MDREKTMLKAKGFAMKMLAEHGTLNAMVSVHSKEGAAGVLPYDGTNRAKYATVETIKLVRKAGLFDFALLISEAWMAALPKGTTREQAGTTGFRASEQPNKKEVVIVHYVGDDGTTDTGIWPMLRDGAGKPFLGAEILPPAGANSESWLDEAVR